METSCEFGYNWAQATRAAKAAAKGKAKSLHILVFNEDVLADRPDNRTWASEGEVHLLPIGERVVTIHRNYATGRLRVWDGAIENKLETIPPTIFDMTFPDLGNVVDVQKRIAEHI